MIVTSRAGSGLAIDQLALRTAAVWSQREFAAVFDTETIEHVVYTSHDQVGGDSAVTRFLRAERFARQRLQALARRRGHDGIGIDGKPIVLFLETHNASHSPMAVGFFRHLTEERAVAWSSGCEPATRSTRLPSP